MGDLTIMLSDLTSLLPSIVALIAVKLFYSFSVSHIERNLTLQRHLDVLSAQSLSANPYLNRTEIALTLNI